MSILRRLLSKLRHFPIRSLHIFNRNPPKDMIEVDPSTHDVIEKGLFDYVPKGLYDYVPKDKYVFGPLDRFLLINKNRHRAILLPGQDTNAELGIGWLTESNTPESYDKLWGSEEAISSFLAEADSIREIMPREIIDAIRDKISPASSVIDVGCGVGDLLIEVRKRYPHAVLSGCDFSKAAIAKAKELLPGASIKESHIDRSLPYEINSFDIVLCTDVLEHLEYPADIAAELVRICQPGGIVAIVVPDGDVDNFLGHLWFWNEISLGKMLEKWTPTIARLPLCKEFIAIIDVKQ